MINVIISTPYYQVKYLKGLSTSNLNYFPFQFLKKGFLAEKEFLSDNHIEYSLRAESYSTLAYIDQDIFIDLIKKNEKCFEQYKMVKESLIFDKQNSAVSCLICQKLNHQFSECDQLFYIPNAQILINSQESRNHDRVQYARFDLKSFNSRKNRNLVSITAMGFCVQHFNNEQEDFNEQIHNSFSCLDDIFDDGNSKHTMNNQQTINSPSSNHILASVVSGVQQRAEFESNSNYTLNTKKSGTLDKNKYKMSDKQSFTTISNELKSRIIRKKLSKRLSTQSPNRLSLKQLTINSQKEVISHNELQETYERLMQDEQNLLQIYHKINKGQITPSSCEIDRIQSFKYYYPHFNIEVVIDLVNNRN